jgi:HSP20 family protein
MLMALFLEPFAPFFNGVAPGDIRGRFLGGVRPFMPPADVLVTDEDVTVYMDVPGLNSETLEIELENDLLTVRGERTLPYTAKTENGNGGSQWQWQHFERSFGAFERTVRVPTGLDPDAIEASISDGVLTLRLPKPEALKPKRIQINAAATQTRQLEGATA